MKNKKRTYTIAVIVAGLVAILGYYFWVIRWRKFTDNGQAGSLQIKFGDGSNTGGGAVAFKSIKPHGLKVGDKVEIKQQPGAEHSSYDGSATVNYVISDTIFAIDKSFMGNTPVNPGEYRKKFF